MAATEASKPAGKIHSFGLEFGPNFFMGHFFSDISGEHHLRSVEINEGEWGKYQDQLAEAGMPLFSIVHTPNWTLIPSLIFDEDRAEHFLNFNTTQAGTGTIAWDNILPLDAVLLYHSETLAENFLTTHYPGLESRHAAGLLLEIIQRKQEADNETATYIHQLGNAYHVSVYKSGKLELTNFIEAPYFEDIRYYTLFTLKQLGIALTNPIYLLGQAAANDELRNGLKKYCSRVERLQYSKSHMGSPAECEYFIALNAHRCG